MRRVLWISLLSLLAASPASATELRDPVKLRLRSEPRAAEAGRPYAGTLWLQVADTLEITNLRLEGEGWTVRRFDAAGSVRLGRRDTLSIGFLAVPERADVPLQLRYEVAGRTWSKPVDLSPRAMERGKTRSVRTDDSDPGPGRGVRRALPEGKKVRAAATQVRRRNPAHATAEAALLEETAEPHGAEEVPQRTIRVRGRFTYERADGERIGAYGVLVEVYDEDPWYDPDGDDLLDSELTDSQGYFDVSFGWDGGCWLCESDPDLYVYLETESGIGLVQDGSVLEVEYSWETGTRNNYGGSDLDFGSFSPGDEDDYPALHLMTGLSRTWVWLNDNLGYDPHDVHIRWPSDQGSGVPAYISWSEEIHVPGNSREWNSGDLIHEYGHHWIHHYSVPRGSDYCNGICDSGPGCGHCVWCPETGGDAFNEGFPNWLANRIGRDYEPLYGDTLYDPIGLYSMETLGSCSSAANDPTRTENFFAALLVDIDDTAQDDNDGAGGWRDRLTMGISEIFSVVDNDNPTSPTDFLNEFKANYPAWKEPLWETAKDIGYEIDAQNPSPPTNLASAYHTLGVESPVSRIRILWDRALDDASGPAGYGIYLSVGGAGAPSNVQDIGDVTAWSSTPQAPGTYFFNIKTVDRAGRWSSDYVSIGPIVIRELIPANLVYDLKTGWSRELVPRGAADATSASVPEPTTLTGNANGTYFNYSGVVWGEVPTEPFTTRVSADGVGLEESSWGSMWPGSRPFDINEGPYTVRGGRHTLDVFWDIGEGTLETDENDNLWAHQWIWTPYVLTAGAAVVRNAPPDRTQGWDYVVDGSTLWFNCDGLRLSTTGWWNAVWTHASSGGDDFDCRLHAASSGAGNGFASNLGYSTRAAGCLDAVIVNKNVAAAGNYDVGVIDAINPSDPFAQTYRAEHVISLAISVGDSLPIAMAQDKMLILREFQVGPADVGPISMVVDVDPADGPLYLAWLDATFATGDLMDYDGYAATDAAGRARLDVVIPATGYHCVVVYRDPKDGRGPISLTLEVEKTPPDYVPYPAAGWYAPMVPRAAADGTPALVPVPVTLTGNAAATYFNYAVLNDSPSAAPSGMTSRVDVDGASSWPLGWSSFSPHVWRALNSVVARTVRGGRHTVAVRHDGDALIDEIDEDDNAYGEQWIWSPLALALHAAVIRSAPPDRTGGWDRISTAEGRWYNCDGLRTAFVAGGDDGYWGAIAVMPGAASDVDVRLHEASTGAKSGFASNLRTSAWGPGQSDYVLVNFNLTGHRTLDAGVLLGEGDEGYTAEAVAAVWRGSIAGAYSGAHTLAAGRILQLHEFNVPAGTWRVRLVNLAGAVDWGLTLHAGDQAYLAKSSALASAWENGAGLDEEFTTTLLAPGLLCVAVWKATSADLGTEGQYLLLFGDGTVGLEDPPADPATTRLALPQPNPFGDSAGIAFELARAGEVALEVFDVHGARVRTLVAGWHPAGRRRMTWDGCDDEGRRLAPGVYLVRLIAGDHTGRRKVVMLR